MPRRPQRRLVHEIANVGARHADGRPRQPFEIDVIGQRHAARMNLEQLAPPGQRRPIDRDVPIEPPRPQQRRVEHVGPVRGRQHDHRARRAEAVHLAEDLIERLLAFVVPAAEAGAALPADGVDFVDEQNRRRVRLGRLEQVAHAAGADAHEQLNELRAVDRKERHARLAGHRLGQQRLAGARRTHQQHALRHPGAELLKLGRVAQEVDDLLQVLLHVAQAGDVVKRQSAAHRPSTAAPGSAARRAASRRPASGRGPGGPCSSRR